MPYKQISIPQSDFIFIIKCTATPTFNHSRLRMKENSV